MPKMIWGCVVVDGKEYDCNEMQKLDPAARWIYGIDWTYAGDLSFKECDIVVEDHAVFTGTNALKNALQFAHKG